MQTCAYEIGKLVGILDRGRHADSSWPVEVQVSELVCEELHLARWKSILVVNHVVAGRIHSSLSDGLRYDIEIVSLWVSDYVVDDCSTVGVAHPLGCHESGTDPLGSDDEGELDVRVDLADGLLDGRHLGVEHMRDLTLTNTIPVEEDLGWDLTIVGNSVAL